jgi:hypothetical protein
MVKSLLVTKPEFLNAVILPDLVKQQYLESYQQLIDQLPQIQVPIDYNASDPHNNVLGIKEQAYMCVNILSQPEPSNAKQLRQQMVEHCRKWDQVYGYDARILYPELADVWTQHGY